MKSFEKLTSLQFTIYENALYLVSVNIIANELEIQGFISIKELKCFFRVSAKAEDIRLVN